MNRCDGHIPNFGCGQRSVERWTMPRCACYLFSPNLIMQAATISLRLSPKKICTSLILLMLVLVLPEGNAFGQSHWVGSWAASQQLPEPRNSLAPDDLKDATLRQIVHLSIGGTELRVHLSNRFGTAPVHFTSVHIARPVSTASAKIVPETDRVLTFSGMPDVTVPAGAEYLSDPIAFSVAPLSDLAITLHIDLPPASQAGHPGSRATSYLVHGDLVSAPDLPDPKTFEHWYFIAGVDVVAPPDAAAVVALGDSITDGHGATTNGNDRWTDALAKRLQADPATRNLAVLNHGLGGNRLLLDGLGPNALARINDDVLAQAGVRYLIVLEGVNDLGVMTRDSEVAPAEHQSMVQRIIAAYQQIVARAHANGIQVFGGTIMPFVGSGYYHPGPSTEADRQAINEWIRTPNHFDAVVDFDKAMRDPQHPDRLLPAFDSGDHLHPSPAGYAAMAEAIPLSLFHSRPMAEMPAPKLAFTFDDLPAHGPLPPGESRSEIASKVLAALRAAHLPPVYGFVNGVRIEEQPSDVAVLQAWRAAGQPLGNHTWSHMNLNQHTLKEFEADTEGNEPLLSKWMKKKDWHWLRYPYLAEGNTPEKRAGVRVFLAQHGYRIADVTMSFSDYLWNDPYARCVAKKDDKAIALLKSSYLAAADQSIGYYRRLSHALYGRDIPYVLLMHIGAFDARMLPRLLDLYRSRGFQFVTLPEAENDEFYREDTDLNLPPGPDSLEGMMELHHLPLPPHIPRQVQLDTMCR
jgi:lysophospholipase L1-like esterase